MIGMDIIWEIFGPQDILTQIIQIGLAKHRQVKYAAFPIFQSVNSFDC